jgi:hypothetical protein
LFAKYSEKRFPSGFWLSNAMPSSGSGKSHNQHLIRQAKYIFQKLFRPSTFNGDAFFRGEIVT